MGDWQIPTDAHSIVVHPGSSRVGLGGGLPMCGAMSTTATWPTANLAIYVPFRIIYPYSPVNIIHHNGSTTAGNRDLGVYDIEGNRLVSTGSITTTSSNSIQNSTISVTLLPGLYYYAMSCASATNVTYGWTTANAAQAAAYGCYQQASALPLPATATFAAMASSFIPLVVLSERSLV
jgi:hypothetical protein